MASPFPLAAAVGFAVSPRFTLDTRPPATEPGFAVSPAFQLSTLLIGGRDLTAEGAPLVANVRADGFETRSTADGSFRLAGVRPGQRYTVSASVAGHIPQAAPDISVAEGRSVAGLELRLAPATLERLAVLPLWPPQGTASSVMQGGTAIRYFRVVDEAGQGRSGAQVGTSLGGEPAQSDDDGVVAVPIPWSAVGTGAPGSVRQVQVVSVDGRQLDAPLGFEVGVTPRDYAMAWDSQGYSRVGISFVNVERARGSALRLHQRDGRTADFEELEVGRQVRTGVGAEASLGATAGVWQENARGVRIDAGARAEATAEGMLSAVSEDRYRFGYPDRSATQAMAQYVLIADGMVGSLSPHLVNLRAFVETRLAGSSPLQAAYVYGGRSLDLMGGARATASAGVAVALGRQAQAGLAVRADGRGEAHGTLTWAEYPRQGEGSLAVGLTAQGRAQGRAEAGFIVTPTGRNRLGAVAFAGLGAAGLVGGELEFVFAREALQRVQVATRTRGAWGSQVGAGFPPAAQQRGRGG